MASILVASAPLMNAPDPGSGRETDCLYGESVTIHARDGDWCDITLETDHYRGWLHASAIGTLPPATHRIIAPRSLLTTGADIKTPAASTPSRLPRAAQAHAASNGITADGMMAIEGEAGRIGYLPSRHLMPLDGSVDDWVAIAESLIGVPYRWGGRDSIGIDCSALVQLALAAAGRPVMRNSSDQEKTIGKTISPDDGLERGDLVFWKGHVGIMTDAETLLHANMHHAMTATEPLKQALVRLEGLGLPATRFARP